MHQVLLLRHSCGHVETGECGSADRTSCAEEMGVGQPTEDVCLACERLQHTCGHVFGGVCV